MFYSQLILSQKGPLGKIWLAAHWDKKLTKQQIFTADIHTSVDSIVNPQVPLALRVSGHLLLGVVRIYSRKVEYLYFDCTDAQVKINQAFRPGVADMPAGKEQGSSHAINVNSIGSFEAEVTYSIDAVAAPSLDEFITASSQTMARRQDITLADPLEQVREESEFEERDGVAVEDSFGGGEWNAFDLDETMDASGLDISAVSDIEVAREAGSAMPALNDSGLINMANKSLNDDSFLMGGEQADTSFNDVSFEMPADDALEVDNAADASMNLSGNPLDISADLNVSINNGSRTSLDSALANAEELTASRPKKKRKITRDTETELSSAFLKAGMADTSAITRSRENTYQKRARSAFDFSGQIGAEIFTRPSITGISEDLMGMFKVTMRKRRFPFGSVDKRSSMTRGGQGVNSDIRDIEQTRHLNYNSAAFDPRESMGSHGSSFLQDAEENQFEFADMSMDHADSDTSGFVDYDVGAPFEPEAQQDAEDPNADIELGPVNDLEGNDGRSDPANASTAQHKWHPHTVKVMKFLRKSLDHKEEVTYKQLTRNTHDRRTAAGLFFELLQLKTLDYVDVEQADPYGDIKISKATRFSETIPGVDPGLN